MPTDKKTARKRGRDRQGFSAFIDRGRLRLRAPPCLAPESYGDSKFRQHGITPEKIVAAYYKTGRFQNAT